MTHYHGGTDWQEGGGEGPEPHLPECFCAKCNCDVADDCCICDRLRQAEQRGIQKALTAWRDTEPIHDEEVIQAERDRIRTGVKALTEWPYLPPSWSKDFLAVIDPKEGPDD